MSLVGVMVPSAAAPSSSAVGRPSSRPRLLSPDVLTDLLNMSGVASEGDRVYAIRRRKRASPPRQAGAASVAATVGAAPLPAPAAHSQPSGPPKIVPASSPAPAPTPSPKPHDLKDAGGLWGPAVLIPVPSSVLVGGSRVASQLGVAASTTSTSARSSIGSSADHLGAGGRPGMNARGSGVNPLTGLLPTAPAPTLAEFGLPTSTAAAPRPFLPREIRLPRGFSSASRRAADSESVSAPTAPSAHAIISARRHDRRSNSEQLPAVVSAFAMASPAPITPIERGAAITPTTTSNSASNFASPMQSPLLRPLARPPSGQSPLITLLRGPSLSVTDGDHAPPSTSRVHSVPPVISIQVQSSAPTMSVSPAPPVAATGSELAAPAKGGAISVSPPTSSRVPSLSLSPVPPPVQSPSHDAASATLCSPKSARLRSSISITIQRRATPAADDAPEDAPIGMPSPSPRATIGTFQFPSTSTTPTPASEDSANAARIHERHARAERERRREKPEEEWENQDPDAAGLHRLVISTTDEAVVHAPLPAPSPVLHVVEIGSDAGLPPLSPSPHMVSRERSMPTSTVSVTLSPHVSGVNALSPRAAALRREARASFVPALQLDLFGRRGSSLPRRESNGAGESSSAIDRSTFSDDDNAAPPLLLRARTEGQAGTGTVASSDDFSPITASDCLSPLSALSDASRRDRLLLLDPLTGLPLERARKRSSAVYMGMLPDETATVSAPNALTRARSGSASPPPTTTSNRLSMAGPADFAAAREVLNALSPLHTSAVTSAAAAGADPVPGTSSVKSMMSAVKVERVELRTQFKAPTLMQQAKVITAAIILQKQARIAERRAILHKRQQEADALEHELNLQNQAHEMEFRQARARERAEREHRRGGDADHKDDSHRGSTEAKESYVRVPRTGSGALLSFSEFDFSGTGTAWAKDQIGSHLRPTAREAALLAGPSDVADDDKNSSATGPLRVHPTGFGSGRTTDNNGAHHPLMNPTHPNFFSHLNPESENYNSHINPRHVNYNPVNNPHHPSHDPVFNNPKSPMFNPFYKHPRAANNKEYIQQTMHLHKGSKQHPAHPDHPLFTPHAVSVTNMLDGGSAGGSDHGSLGSNGGAGHTFGSRTGSALKASPAGSMSAGSPRAAVGSGGRARRGGARPRRADMSPASPTSPGGSTTIHRRRVGMSEKDREEDDAAQWSDGAYGAMPGADPMTSLDLSPNADTPVAQQLARFSHQQLEQLRRDAVDLSLGMMPSPGGPRTFGTPRSPGGITVGPMSRFFREQLLKAIGGDDVWRIAQEMHARPSVRRGEPDDPLKGISLSSLSLKAHMALFGAGALTDSDGRPIDEYGFYLDGDESDGHLGRALAISPFPPKRFFLRDETERYEAELREQLMKEHAERVREYEDVVNVAKRRWHTELASLAAADLHEQSAERLHEKSNKVTENAAFLGRSVANQWNIY